ncbi:hypothetical protein CTAYLR_003845 [Chrysophaeum taylorii]|uniref:Mitochondrial carrier protein n=1 Tax=Chrysophaeum taylorii TaxID=2483200 RepID=A0AAD7UEF5_9STRA|nr:hypothetical protein CTAYLR_003845 [Chrysophaeum taylorii]
MEHVVAGSVGGIASILVCHPLDTVRVRLQTDPGCASAWECAKKAGLRGLYRGLLGPVLAQGAYKAILFGVYDFSKRRIGDSPAALFACGGLAGAANAVVLTPVELVRNKQQTSSLSFREALSFASYRGFGATLCRDVPGVGAYYVAFEVLRGPAFWQNCVAGAAGGAAFWTIALPFDHIKNRLQVERRATVLRILQDTSLPRLYVGYGSALLRGIPGAAVVFGVYGLVIDALA